MNRGYALVTISDESFAVGAEVLIYSFLKRNSWFNGDIVVFDDHLSPITKERLLKLSNRVIFEPIGESIKTKVQNLGNAIPSLKDILPRFYTLEVFRLKYERVVFLDSDTLCTKSIHELFTISNSFCAAPDSCFYRDALRDRETYEQIPLDTFKKNYGGYISNSFNSGVMSIGKKYLNDAVYNKLIALIEPSTWKEIEKPRLADQIILNFFFENNTHILSGEFNYVIFLDDLIRAREGIGVYDAKIIHYAGRFKPWYVYDKNKLLEIAPTFLFSFEEWLLVYNEIRNNDITNIIQQHLEWWGDLNKSKVTDWRRID